MQVTACSPFLCLLVGKWRSGVRRPFFFAAEHRAADRNGQAFTAEV